MTHRPSVLEGDAPLVALALVSGAAGLVYELVWVRWFAELFGSTARAGAAVVAAYFGSLAIGARWVASRTPRMERPLLVYAALEAAAAAGALLVPFVITLWEPWHASLYASQDGSRAALTAAKVAFAFAALAPPCIALGGTLPVLAHALRRGRPPSAAARWTNVVYGVNTLGGALGVVLGALVLPQRLGILGTYLCATALQGIAIGGALVVGRDRRVPRIAPVPAVAGPAGSRIECVGAAAAGAGALALQILLLRALDQLLVGTFFSVGATLAATLVAIAVAALVASSRAVTRRLPIGAVAFAVGFGLIVFPRLFTAELASLAEMGGVESHRHALYSAARVVVALGVPVLLGASLLLPWIVARAERAADERRVAFRVGRLLAWNIAGGVAGSLLAGFVLLPAVGLWAATTLVAAAYVLAGFASSVRGSPFAASVGLAAAASALWLSAPWGAPRAWLQPDETLVAIHEGAGASVAVVDDASGRAMRLDNHYTLAGTALALDEARRGHVPLLLHPDPRRVAFLGSATGLTAAAALAHPEVRALDLVEIVPEVAEAARRYFADWNGGVYDAPITTVRVEDARNHVRIARERYDVIVGELFIPWNPGASGLFSHEHFEAVASRLAPGGLFCQWLPLHQLGRESFEVVVATYRDVFPKAFLWRGSFHPDKPVAALCSDGRIPRVEVLTSRLARLRDAGVRDRWLAEPAAFGALAVGPLSTLAIDVPRNTDDRPWIELSSFRDSTEPLVGARWQRWTRAIADHNEAGQVLYDYQLARLEGREQDVQRLARRARALFAPGFFGPPEGR